MTGRIVQISDTHLSPERPFFQHNWEVLVELLNADPPDLVICTGDISINGAADEAELAFAAGQLRRLRSETLIVPGNHDVGNSLPDVRGGEPLISADRLLAFRRTVGPDYWAKDFEQWRLVGLNAMLPGSALPEDREQWTWLEETLAGAGRRKTMVFMHKPLFLNDPDDPVPTQSSMYPEHRRSLIEMLDRHRVSALATGHQHDYRRQRIGRTRLIWAPSTAFVIDASARLYPRYGTRRVGYVEHRVAGRRLSSRFVEPHLLVNFDVGNWMRDPDGFLARYATEPLRGLQLARQLRAPG